MANICENKIAVYGSKENIAVFNEYIQAKEKESEKDCYSTFFFRFYRERPTSRNLSVKLP